jgi:hypothetical protein
MPDPSGAEAPVIALALRSVRRQPALTKGNQS